GEERQELAEDVLALVVPWALGELGLMAVSIRIPEDDVSLTGAAVAAGMREAVRLRKAVRRPGERVDLLIFERVNPDWGRRWRGDRDGDA
ncbi:MAG TPA: hypothetical protein VNZ55_05320, partial [Thermomicrobiales bacterium]|nr:hypothetical protein [Thermomicrobiales bacterium]